MKNLMDFTEKEQKPVETAMITCESCKARYSSRLSQCPQCSHTKPSNPQGLWLETNEEIRNWKKV